MTIDDAIRMRIKELSKEKKITISEASLAGGLTPSTVYAFTSGISKHIQCNTLKALCMGYGVSLKEFFDRDYFDDYE